MLTDLQQEAPGTSANSTTTSYYINNNNEHYISDYYDGDTEPFQSQPHTPASNHVNSPEAELNDGIETSILPDLQQEAPEPSANSTTTSHYNNNNTDHYYSDYYDGNTEAVQNHPHIPASPPAASPEAKLNDAQQYNNNNKKKTT